MLVELIYGKYFDITNSFIDLYLDSVVQDNNINVGFL